MIPILSIDPAMRNLGLVRLDYDIKDDRLDVTWMNLIHTENAATKTTRKNSDDLRRARELYDALVLAQMGVKVVIGEVPSGSQSSRASYGFGMAVGVLASIKKPFIEVQPIEAKKAAIGKKTASKAEMIDWAVSLYPEAGWLRLNNKPNGRLLDANEHLADAIAIAHAGVKTDQFRGMIVLMDAHAKA